MPNQNPGSGITLLLDTLYRLPDSAHERREAPLGPASAVSVQDGGEKLFALRVFFLVEK